MKELKIIWFTLLFSFSISAVICAREVNFQSEDGIPLAGTFENVPQSKGTVILVHMLNHDRKDWSGFSQFLNSNGWNTLSFDLRGHGESRGTDKKLDWKTFSKQEFRQMVRDLDGAINWLKQDQTVATQSLFLIGASIGANLALEYASSHPEIAGVVLLSPGVDYRGVRPKEAAIEYRDRPILFVASDEDTFSISSSDFLYQLVPTQKKEIIKLQAKGHGTEMLTGDMDLRDKIVTFLAKSTA